MPECDTFQVKLLYRWVLCLYLFWIRFHFSIYCRSIKESIYNIFHLLFLLIVNVLVEL